MKPFRNYLGFPPFNSTRLYCNKQIKAVLHEAAADGDRDGMTLIGILDNTLTEMFHLAKE